MISPLLVYMYIHMHIIHIYSINLHPVALVVCERGMIHMIIYTLLITKSSINGLGFSVPHCYAGARLRLARSRLIIG